MLVRSGAIQSTVAISTCIAGSALAGDQDVTGRWAGVIELPQQSLATKLDLWRDGKGWTGTVVIAMIAVLASHSGLFYVVFNVWFVYCYMEF